MTLAELVAALASGARIIGVNSRNLDTFAVNTRAAWTLFRRIPKDIVAVAESGMATPDDVRAAAEAGADAVLIGTALSAAAGSRCLGGPVYERTSTGGEVPEATHGTTANTETQEHRSTERRSNSSVTSVSQCFPFCLCVLRALRDSRLLTRRLPAEATRDWGWRFPAPLAKRWLARYYG